MSEDIMTAMSRILFYGATWGSVAVVAAGQCGHTREERVSAAESRRRETGRSRERSRGALRLIEQKHERRERFLSLGLTPSTAANIALAMKKPAEEPVKLPIYTMAEVETALVPATRGQYALPLGNVLQLPAKTPAPRARTLQHAHAA